MEIGIEQVFQLYSRGYLAGKFCNHKELHASYVYVSSDPGTLRHSLEFSVASFCFVKLYMQMQIGVPISFYNADILVIFQKHLR